MAPPGEQRRLAGPDALPLNDPSTIWWIDQGQIDLFAVEMVPHPNGGPPTLSNRRFIAALPAGVMLFGAAPRADGLTLAAFAPGGASLRALDMPALLQPTEGQAGQTMAAHLDYWIRALAEGAALHAPRRPEQVETLTLGEAKTLAAEGALQPTRGVLWLYAAAGTAKLWGAAPFLAPGLTLPVTPGAWVAAGEHGCSLTAYGTVGVVAQGGWDKRLGPLHDAVLTALAQAGAERLRAEAERVNRLSRRTEADLADTVVRFARVLEPGLGRVDGDAVHPDDALAAACRKVAEASDALTASAPSAAVNIDAFIRGARIRQRQVALRGRWFEHDAGPLLGFREEGRRPLALLPRGKGYVAWDPFDGREKKVDDALAMEISPIAHMFYPPLPDRAVTPWDLLTFGLKACRSDLKALVGFGALGGILALGPPMGVGLAIDSLIPGHQGGLLIQLAVALIVAALSGFIFKLVSDFATLRVEGRIASRLQAAVIDRVLRLPNRLLSSMNSADLAMRALVVDQMRRLLSGVAIAAGLGAASSLFSAGLLLIYVPWAGVATLLISAAFIGLTVWAGRAQVKALFEGEQLTANAYSFIHQLIGHMRQIRSAGAEERAFIRWGRSFAEMRARMLRARGPANLFQAGMSAFDAMALGVSFIAVAAGSGTGGAGAFVAFAAAFATFTAAITHLAAATQQIYMASPAIGRAKPILETPPEVDAAKADPGPLSGAIDISHVTFRYQPGAAPVLDDVSFSMQPGQFIALVGPSGCGKSTLMKILLGFEPPESGGVYFDGRDLRKLDVLAVRRRIGVVLQAGKLIPGSLFENILASYPGTIDDAWDAARSAGMEEDIRRLPMGMHTMLTEGAAALSGGQAQRLLIARALVSKPKILLMDEATSALDNRTQAIVTDSLDRLAATRIVIAHRLSTIEKADVIHVMNAGRIVESGNYRDLMAKGGLFADLARRQIR